LSILLVGCGNMGRALLTAWLRVGITDIYIVKPSPIKIDESVDISGVKYFKTMEELPDNFLPQVILFAVKPQMLAEILPLYARKFAYNPLYLSVAAGKKLDFYAEKLGTAARVIRVMPNTPTMIGEGMTALFANTKIIPEDMIIAENLLQPTGEILWLANEQQMDVVTAVCGSGPAYIFYFMEAMIAAAEKNGLDKISAKMLVRQTVRGSAGMALMSDEDLNILRENVTSPNGTTAAGLRVLMSDGKLQELLDATIASACQRSKELSA